MRKIYHKTLCLVALLLCFILLFTISANGYDYYTYSSYSKMNDVRLLKNSEEVFLVAKNKNEIFIEAVYPLKYDIRLSLDNEVYSYNLFDNIFVITCPNRYTKQTTIYLYDIDSDYFTSFVIDKTYTIEYSQICYCDTYIYISDDNGYVNKYSNNGELLETFNIHHDTVHLAYDLSSCVYAFTNNGVFKLSNDAIKLHKGTIATPVQFINNNVFIDDLGYYYEIKQDRIVKAPNFNSTVYIPSGGMISDKMLITDNNTIYAIDKSSNNIEKYINIPTYIELIYSIDSTIVSLSYESGCPIVSIIPFGSMLDYKQNNSNLEIKSTNEIDDDTQEITSDTYTIDNKKYAILDIPYGTTIGEFKRNICYDGFKVQFTRYDGKIIKSGNVGTATIVKFYTDDFFIEYELSVIGDLTGEGNVNSRDKDMMFSYLLDEVNFTGVVIDSADIHKTDKIDTADLVLLLRLIEEQK